MKKNVLALSITAGMLGLGFAGGAQAMTGALTGATANSFLSMNKDGLGHMLLVPYYTAQAENTTLINITNTDTVNGKAVKVRFRGASNSDDVFDFQVFLSPGDVYAFNIAKNTDGSVKFTTNDVSCTKPAKSVLLTTPFVTARLDTQLTGDAKNNGAREGYVEIFNMADIPRVAQNQSGVGDVHFIEQTNLFGANTAGPDTSTTPGDGVNDLYTAIKHVSKVAPCSGTAWTNLDSNNPADVVAARALGLLPPSTGLMANWTIINVVGAAAWSGDATAVQSVTGGNFFRDVAALGNTVYWPQTASSVAAATVVNYTADPLFRADAQKVINVLNATATANVVPSITAANYDLPDMSTPYSAAASSVVGTTSDQYPLVQARNLTETMAATALVNEFLTDSTISATTDWVFSMPTRRYSVAFNYAATISSSDDGRRFSEIVGDGVSGSINNGYFVPVNTLVTARQICVSGINYIPRDREETVIGSSTEVVISPSTPGAITAFCGEASVLSINNGAATTTAALKANVAVKDLTVPYTDGWMTMTTPSGGAVAAGPAGLPVLGGAYIKALGNGTQTFGATWPHRFIR